MKDVFLPSTVMLLSTSSADKMRTEVQSQVLDPTLDTWYISRPAGRFREQLVLDVTSSRLIRQT